MINNRPTRPDVFIATDTPYHQLTDRPRCNCNKQIEPKFLRRHSLVPTAIRYRLTRRIHVAIDDSTMPVPPTQIDVKLNKYSLTALVDSLIAMLRCDECVFWGGQSCCAVHAAHTQRSHCLSRHRFVWMRTVDEIHRKSIMVFMCGVCVCDDPVAAIVWPTERTLPPVTLSSLFHLQLHIYVIYL